MALSKFVFVMTLMPELVCSAWETVTWRHDASVAEPARDGTSPLVPC